MVYKFRSTRRHRHRHRRNIIDKLRRILIFKYNVMYIRVCCIKNFVFCTTMLTGFEKINMAFNGCRWLLLIDNLLQFISCPGWDMLFFWGGWREGIEPPKIFAYEMTHDHTKIKKICINISFYLYSVVTIKRGFFFQSSIFIINRVIFVTLDIMDNIPL